MAYFSDIHKELDRVMDRHFDDTMPSVIRIPKEHQWNSVIDTTDDEADFFVIALEAGPVQVVIEQAGSLKEAIAVQRLLAIWLDWRFDIDSDPGCGVANCVECSL